MRALLSVTDKTGITGFAATLHRLGWEVTATEGTAKLLVDHGIPARPVSTWLDLPSLLDGRVKTLHHKIFLALLCRGDRPAQMAEATANGVTPIDLLVGDFYRFGDPDPANLMDTIDIGGPSMMRAAAKNHPWVIPVTDSTDYPRIGRLLAAAGGSPQGVDLDERRALAAKAFRRLADLDAEIGMTLNQAVAAHPEP